MSEKIMTKTIKPLKYNKKYTHEEALAASGKYFKENLPADVFVGKYALRDTDGNPVELTPDALHERMAHEFARIDAQKYGLDFDERYGIYFDAMKNFSRIVPQGSPMSSIGNPFQVMSASNCVVVESPKDSIAGIMETGTELAQLMKRRCVERNSFVDSLEKGVISIKDLQVGMHVLSFDINNNKSLYKKVINKFTTEVEPENRITITFSNGAKLRTSKKHPVLTFEDNKFSYRNAGELVINDVCLKPENCLELPQYDEKQIDLAWFIGANIGDGTCGKVRKKWNNVGANGASPFSYRFRILGDDEQVVAEYAKILNRLTGSKALHRKSTDAKYKTAVYEYTNSNIATEEILKKYLDNQFGLKVYVAKTPSVIKDNDLWWPYIAGIIDTDGYAKDAGGCISIRLCAKDVIEDITMQLARAGVSYYAYEIQEKVRKNGKKEKKMWGVNIHGNEEFWTLIGPFLRHSNKKQLIQNKKIREFSHKKNITSFEREEIICLYKNSRKKGGRLFKGELPDSPEEKKRKGNLSSCIILLQKGDVGIGALNSFKEEGLISSDKLKEICQRTNIISVSQDLSASEYIDIEVQDTNNFYAGNFGLINIHNCGVGLDISTLRPDGFKVNNASRTTSGAYSFADFFSYITRMIGQQGRRGALMVTISVHHPDVIAFATMKADLKKVTGANISIRLSDEFLKAVDEDSEYEQYWPLEGERQYTKKVKARDVWKIIIDTACACAEPGLIFWDRMTKYLPAHSYKQFRSRSTNPCCFAEDSEVNVITKEGVKLLVEVEPTDLVWIDSAQKWAPTSGYFSVGNAEVYRVQFSNGVKFDVTDNHKFESYTTKDLIELHQLKVGDKISCSTNRPTGMTAKPWQAEYLCEPLPCVEIKSIERLGVKKVGCISVSEYHRFTASGIISGNSEICLSAYDSCRLITLNATGYIRNAFTAKAKFDWEAFASDIRLATQMCDNLVDLELELIERIKSACDGEPEKALWHKLWQAGHDGRRTGLGTHGLADALAQLNIKYDSDEALKMVDKIYNMLRDESYDASIELSKIRGPFPAWDWDVDKDNAFIQQLPSTLLEKIQKHGRRNISQLTQAPTGSVSIISKCGEFDRFNVSSGVEPVFRNFYIRRKKINPNDKARVDFKDEMGDCWQEYPVFHPNVKNYLEKVRGYKLDITDENLDEATLKKLKEEKLPDFFVTSDQIDWKYRVKLQGIEQQYLDHSISSTINLSKGTTPETVGQIYLDGWKQNLKGLTVYVDGSRNGVLITDGNGANKVDANGRPLKLISIMAPKRPKALPCEIHQATVEGTKWTVIIGLFEGKPYEMFSGYSEHLSLPTKYKNGQLVKHGKGKYALHVGEGDDELVIKDVISVFNNPQAAWTTRLISLSLRHSVDAEFVVEQLSKDGRINDTNRVLARVLKKYIPEGKKVQTSNSCANKLSSGAICGSTDLKYSEGCQVCQSCGYTKCN